MFLLGACSWFGYRSQSGLTIRIVNQLVGCDVIGQLFCGRKLNLQHFGRPQSNDALIFLLRSIPIRILIVIGRGSGLVKQRFWSWQWYCGNGKRSCLTQSCIAVARVASGSQATRANIWKHLFHHFAEVGCRQRFYVDSRAVGTEIMNILYIHCVGFSVQNSQVIIVHILLWNGHVCIVLQMRPYPVDGVIDLGTSSQWVLWLSQRILKQYKECLLNFKTISLYSDCITSFGSSTRHFHVKKKPLRWF